ncbi:DEKNAAC101361 [Brettanomyces naardenensis]|uniref:DEKNAAC101361 n=1 Tax=Brettanomyces naardenensis TaxID=13370 RepID=A0A448YHN8_BRENA|nr:DEKNAAC101361 [Brettanomyces naardenensis]
MSMFNSLANSPGVITLFKTSSAILADLEKFGVTSSAKDTSKDKGLFASILGDRKQATSGRYRYQIDVSNSLPTLEQFDLIKSYSQTTPYSAEAFLDAFPRLADSSRDWTFDKALGKDAFDGNGKPKSLRELAAEGLFVTPLAVDWEHRLLASRIGHLKKLLEVYGVKQ